MFQAVHGVHPQTYFFDEDLHEEDFVGAGEDVSAVAWWCEDSLLLLI